MGDAQWNVPFDLDRRAIGDEVSIELIVQALRVDWQDRGYRSDPSKSIGEMLEAVIAEKGIEAAVATYTGLRADSSADVNFDRSELQLLGRRLLQEERVREAITIHGLNAVAYPTSATTHANLGRAHAAAGREWKALRCVASYPSAVTFFSYQLSLVGRWCLLPLLTPQRVAGGISYISAISFSGRRTEEDD